ncbi:MAG: hypothetical protein B6U86_05375 [Candidatus Altiarchaeales archaeon ex4484_43]|nr:MAG: hypothetical protein B6U86_05375 [Candidatus Altiarchaeales archaeon ex4484_43]
MRVKKTGLTFFLVLIFVLNSVSAQSLEVTDISLNPSVIWLDDDPRITISARCIYNGSSISDATVSVEIQSPGGLTTPGYLWYSSGRYSSSFRLDQFYEIGTYTASVTCEYNGYTDTREKTFNVREMSLNIINEGGEINAYMGDVIEIKVDFRVDGRPVSLPKNDFRIYIGEEEVEPVSVIGTASYQKISVDLCPSGNIESCMNKLPEGLYDLEVTACYSSDKRITSKVKNYVRVNSPLISDLTEDDVDVRILGNKVFERVYVESMECDRQSGSCTVKLNIPSNLQPGSYDLFLSLKKKFGDSYYTVEDYIPLQVVLQLSGVMKDAAGDVVRTVITLTNEKTGQVITGTTDYSGRYALDVLPGDYSMEIRFGGTIVRFNNVTISNDDLLLALSGNLIRYDEGHLNSGSPVGVRVIKVIVVEFALPFSSAFLYRYVERDQGRCSYDQEHHRI